MQLIDEVKTRTAAGTRTVELHIGDLTHIQPAEAVDVMVVSAFPDSYAPTPGTVIGALHRAGLRLNGSPAPGLSTCVSSPPAGCPHPSTYPDGGALG